MGASTGFFASKLTTTTFCSNHPSLSLETKSGDRDRNDNNFFNNNTTNKPTTLTPKFSDSLLNNNNTNDNSSDNNNNNNNAQDSTIPHNHYHTIPFIAQHEIPPWVNSIITDYNYEFIPRLTDEARQEAGFKGKNFVYHDRKFDTAYYWNKQTEKLEGIVKFSSNCEGPPGITHGGAIASLMDDALANAVRKSGHRAVTAQLTVNYRKFIPLRTINRVEAQVTKIEGRKIFVSGSIYDESGNLKTEATALFIVPDQKNS